MKKFQDFKLKKTNKYSFNYISTPNITYSQLVHPYIENDVLVLDYYYLNWANKKLKYTYTIKIYKNHTWELNGVKQTKKPKIGQLKAHVIYENENGYFLNFLNYPFNSKIVNQFIESDNCFTLYSTIQFLTKKKASSYIPEYLQRKCALLAPNNMINYKYCDGDFIYRNYKYGLIITKEHKVYNFNFYSFKLIIPQPVSFNFVDEGEYLGLNNKYITIHNQNINEVLYFLENKLFSLLNQVNDKSRLKWIKKLSFSKKQILNKYKLSWYSSFYRIENLNSYRDEDFETLLNCCNAGFPDLINYKQYKKYFDYCNNNLDIDSTDLVMPVVFCTQVNKETYIRKTKDYLYMYSRWKNTFTNNHFPKYPKPQDVERYHDELVEYQIQKQNEEDSIKLQHLNEKYKNLKPNLSKLTYSEDKYSIIIPEKLEDVIKEGKILHHCVGSYINSIVEKRNKIYFLRKNSEINSPYFTVDVDYDNNVRQIHTYYNGNVENSKDSEELLQFISNWCKIKNLNGSQFNSVRCAL